MADIKMDDKGYEFDALARQYNDFFAPAFRILVDGTDIIKEGVSVGRVTVDTTVDPKADSFIIVVGNAFDLEKGEFQWVDDLFQLGKYVEISMGYVDQLETVFYGVITVVRCEYPSDRPPGLVISGMDVSFLMMKGIHSEQWKGKKHSDVVQEIGSKYLSSFEIDATETSHDTIDQNALEDYHYINWLAEDNDFEFFVVGRTMYFRKKQKNKAPVITLVWGKSLKSFSDELNIANQVSQVIVRGWVENEYKVEEARSREVEIQGGNNKTGKDIMKIINDFAKEFVYTNVDSKAEAEKKAESELNRRSMELITGTGESIGLPMIRAGKFIKLEGLGKRYAEPMYLKSVKHTIDTSGFSTSFVVGGNAI